MLMNVLDVWHEMIHTMVKCPTRHEWGYTACGMEFTTRECTPTTGPGVTVFQETDCNVTCLKCIAEPP